MRLFTERHFKWLFARCPQNIDTPVYPQTKNQPTNLFVNHQHFGKKTLAAHGSFAVAGGWKPKLSLTSMTDIQWWFIHLKTGCGSVEPRPAHRWPHQHGKSAALTLMPWS